MTGQELLDILIRACCRYHITGDKENGVIVALDLEGRLFTVVNDRVISRVVPSAILNNSNKDTYYNPGGDTLWPAPEGTCFGYEYPTGNWRVPPAITGAVWEVIVYSDSQSVVRAEIDLINNQQVGIPCEFERHIEIMHGDNSIIQNVTEIIRYVGGKVINKDEFLLAPWSLSQFDSGKNGKVSMPIPGEDDIWDMYKSSKKQRKESDSLLVVDTNTKDRFQLGLNANVPWVEYALKNQFVVKRYSGKLPGGQSLIDISDSPKNQLPSSKGVNLSVYCDPTGFMEIEACGGCPDKLIPGMEMAVEITTEFSAVS